MTKVSTDRIYEVDLSEIDEPVGVIRLDIDRVEISELAKSISEIGLMQPVVLRKNGERYEIIAGHRRFLAHQLLDMKTIKATVNEMDPQTAAISRATENLARVNLTPIEEGAVYLNLIEEHGMSIEQIAQRMGKSPGIIKRRIDVMGMPPQLQKSIHEGLIPVGVAEELWRISDEADLEYHLSLAIENGVTRNVVREWVREWRRKKERPADAGETGGGISPPYLDRPVYISCDLCAGPMKLGDEILYRCCPDCGKQLQNALKSS